MVRAYSMTNSAGDAQGPRWTAPPITHTHTHTQALLVPGHHTHTHTHTALLVPGWKGGLVTWFPVRGIRVCSEMIYTMASSLWQCRLVLLRLHWAYRSLGEPPVLKQPLIWEVWGWSPGLRISNKCQVMALLLVCGPHLEKEGFK